MNFANVRNESKEGYATNASHFIGICSLIIQTVAKVWIYFKDSTNFHKIIITLIVIMFCEYERDNITCDNSVKYTIIIYIMHNFLQSTFTFKNVTVTFPESSAVLVNAILKLDSVSVNLA